MTWLKDVVKALQGLGGEARWTDILEATYVMRSGRKLNTSYLPLRVYFVINENRDGKGRNLFTKVARGVYRLYGPGTRPLEQPTSFEEHRLSDGPRLPPLNAYDEVSEAKDFKAEVTDHLRHLKEFESLVNRPDVTEEMAGAFLKVHPWILGFDSLQVRPEERIGLNGRTDFLVEKVGGDFDVVELKSPRASLFVQSGSPRFPSWSADLKDAVSQVIRYLSRYDALYLFQREESGLDVQYPEGVVVLGRLTDDALAQIIRTHNSFLNRIRIETYDHLIDRAKAGLRELGQGNGDT